MDIERRGTLGLELRQTGTNKPRLIGYAALFNTRSLDLGGFVEVIRPGAFKRTLAAGTDVRAFVEHTPHSIIGRRSNGTLQIEEDAHGLRVEITPNPNTSAGNDVIENVRSGVLDTMSFAFRVAPTGQKWDLDAEPVLRELLDVDLSEVSVVAMAAYPETEVAVRSLTEAKRQNEPPIYHPSVAMRKRMLDLDAR
jgi:HK97 family phage prohead protease